MPISTGQEFTKVFVYTHNNTTYTDVTLEAQSPLGTAFTILAATADFLYLGHDEKFDMAIFDLDNVGSVTPKWEYYDSVANDWEQFIPSSGRLSHDPDFGDMGTAYTFGEDGVEMFPMNILRNWTTNAVDSVVKYWIRVSAPSGASVATVKRIQMRPLNAYCTTQDVFELLQLANIANTTDFTTTTVPSKKTVEQYIDAAQSKIDFRTRKSWRPNYIEEEYHDFNINGFKLRRNDAYKLMRVHIWDGGGFEQKNESRKQDFFLTPDVGVVHFSRYFMLPARFQSYNAPVWRFGGGEFVNPVRVSYLYGRDINTNPQEAGMVYDMAKKLAAIDVIRCSDFGNLVVSGTDRIQLMQRVEGWTAEVEDKLDSLRAFEVF